MAGERAVRGACSRKSEFVACRAAESMSARKLKEQESLKILAACWLDLQECREGYGRLRFPLRFRHLPCWSDVAARGESVASLALYWSQSTPAVTSQSMMIPWNLKACNERPLSGVKLRIQAGKSKGTAQET